MTFESLQIDPRCLRILQKMKITTPTPVQAQAIPPALEGRDIIAIAQTGTGKTLAFGLPALANIAGLAPGQTRMLVLTPTRELAQQVHDVLQPVAQALGLRAACIYGGVGYENQAFALRRGVPIVVATPGRLLDHVERRNTRFNELEVLVLDEADRMLDMGFLPDIRRVLSIVPKDRQTMLFSATFAPEIAALAATLQHDPLRIEVGGVAKPATAVTQRIYTVARDGKLGLLKTLLDLPEVTSTLVFTRTKHGADRVATALAKDGFGAEAIHGGHSQNRRQRAIEGFRRGKHTILVATDVAARGIDVQGITHVINYDIPGTSDDYIHRIGRTARAHATGTALTLVTPDDAGLLRLIERTLGQELERADWEGAVPLPSGGSVRRPGPFPRTYKGGVQRPARSGQPGQAPTRGGHPGRAPQPQRHHGDSPRDEQPRHGTWPKRGRSGDFGRGDERGPAGERKRPAEYSRAGEFGRSRERNRSY